MVFRYWKEDGKTTTIHGVDRVVFDSFDKLNIRFEAFSVVKWLSFAYPVDYKQYTITKT